MSHLMSYGCVVWISLSTFEKTYIVPFNATLEGQISLSAICLLSIAEIVYDDKNGILFIYSMFSLLV